MLKQYVKMIAKENKTNISNVLLLTLVDVYHFLSRKNQQTTSNNKEYKYEETHSRWNYRQ